MEVCDCVTQHYSHHTLLYCGLSVYEKLRYGMRRQMFNDSYGQSEINGGNKDHNSSFHFFYFYD